MASCKICRLNSAVDPCLARSKGRFDLIFCKGSATRGESRFPLDRWIELG